MSIREDLVKVAYPTITGVGAYALSVRKSLEELDKRFESALPPTYEVYIEGGAVYAKDSSGRVRFSGTDAATVIQQAIDATYDAGGGTVYLRNGTYRLTKPLVVKCNLIGESFRTTIDNKMYGVVFTTSLASGVVIYIGFDDRNKQLKNLMIANFGLQGNEWVDGIQIREVVESIFMNVRVQGCTGEGKCGWIVGTGTSIAILNCFYSIHSKYNYNGVLLKAGGEAIVNRNYFLLCGFTNNTNYGAKIEAKGLVNVFDSCDFEECEVGIVDCATGTIILHPYLDRCQKGIRFGEDDAITTGPYILNPFWGSTPTKFEYVRSTPPSVQLPKIYDEGHYFLRGRVAVPKDSTSKTVSFPTGVWLYEYYAHPIIEENYVVLINTDWQTGWYITRSPYGTGFTVYFTTAPTSDTHFSYAVIPIW